MLTMFTWGYWGWGSTTRQLLEAVDAAEMARGFAPPFFVDVRLRRSVRAKGFCGTAFEKTVGEDRYKWMPSLGNDSIATHENTIRIHDPAAAADLLNLATRLEKEKRRVLFFCACEEVLNCHRHTVAGLIQKVAQKTGRHLEIVEWPGDAPVEKATQVKSAILKAVLRGRKSIPMGKTAVEEGIAALPWGSIVTLEGEDQRLPVVTGPAKQQGGWCLPVLNAPAVTDTITGLRTWAARYRKGRGLNAYRV